MTNAQDSIDDGYLPSSQNQMDDLLKILLRHKSLIALGIVAGLVLGAIYFARAVPIYQSSTDVLIVNKRPEAVSGNMMQSYFNDYMSTHKALIVSPVVVSRAIEQSNLSSLRTFANSGSVEGLTGMIIRQMQVDTGAADLGDGADNILTLSFVGPVPEDCSTVVNAVLDSYETYLEETYDTMSANTVDFMVEARDVLLEDLKQQETEYRKFREESPLMTTGDSDGPHPVHDRLSTIQSQQSELVLRRTELEAQLGSIQKALDDGKDKEYLRVLVSNMGLGLDVLEEQEKIDTRAVAQDREERLLEEKTDTMILPLLQQERELLQQYGSNHPLLASVRLRIKETRNYITKLDSRLDSSANVVGRPTSVQADSVQLCVEYLTQELDRIKTSQNLLSTLYEADYEEARKLTHFELTESEFQRNMDRTQQLYDGIVSRIQDAGLVKDYGGFKADVISPPAFGEKVAPDPKKIFGISIFLGAFCGIGLAYLAEMTVNSFRFPEEVVKQMGHALIGHVPQFAPVTNARIKDSGLDPSLDPNLCTYYRPMSAESEAYRGLRTGLFFGNRDKSTKVIQVTSPCPGDGKSTVAANLSVSIAQSGERVLLIDSDMRRPRQNEIFNIHSERGLSTIIALDDEFEDVICRTPIDNLWLLPVGQLPPDPAELLTSPRFGELIHAVRELYDYVIVDSGPVVAVSDPSVVTSHVDGLLLTVRMGKTPRKQALRAREILASVAAPVLGVVVNAVGGSEAREYGYGHYGQYYHAPAITDATPRKKAVAATVR